MKILATGDWHIGKRYGKVDRAAEHRHFLDWLKERAVRTRADVLLVTGDVFDGKEPTPESQEIYYDFLDEISHIRPDLRIIVIAGNHDNPSLLEAPQSILKRHNVEVRGSVEPKESQAADQSDSSLIIPVDGPGGERAWIIAVPYLRRSNFPFDQNYEKSVADYLSALVRAAREKSGAGEPVVMMAHLYASGSLRGNDDGHSETIYVGGEPEIRMSSLTDRPDFLLSGHIHKRMEINGFPWAQYTGSALTMSFAEMDYVHGADLLTFEPGKEMIHDVLEYTPLMKFVSYGPASPADIEKEIEKDRPRLDANMFIETRVLLEASDSDVRDRLEKLVRGMGAEFVYSPEWKAQNSDGGKYSTISKPEDLSSDDIVREVIRRRFAAANDRSSADGAEIMNDEEKALLEEIISLARGGNEEENEKE